MKKYLFLVICLLLFISRFQTSAQVKIGKIYLDKREVFDSTRRDWFFAAPLANALHTLTKDYVIRDELLFEEGDEIDIDLIEETERNLRNMGLFSHVRIELDSVNENTEDVYVVTQDLWSTSPGISFRTGGTAEEAGVRLDETNLAGTATKVSVEALYRTENNIGWQGTGGLYQRRIFRTPFSLEGKIMSNRFRTEQLLTVQKPYLNLETVNSYGFYLTNNYGWEFYYRNPDSLSILPFYERRITDWYSHSWRRNDKLYFTVLTELENIKRALPAARRAYENSGKVLVGFSSLSQKYMELTRLNTYKIEDMPIGGWGTAVLGYTFPIDGRGERLYYVGGQGERSELIGNLYLYGQITGASSFANGSPYYTYEEFNGLSYYRFNPLVLVAARLRQQTAWNWRFADRQLLLDNQFGLRGYTLNNLVGDNRIVSNLELRMYPDIGWWIFKLSGVLFYDVGAVWNQDQMLSNIRFHNSVGFGLRIHNDKATGPQNIIRIDFAFNFDEKRFGQIILSSDQLFSVFAKHEYRLPEIYGLEYDME